MNSEKWKRRTLPTLKTTPPVPIPNDGNKEFDNVDGKKPRVFSKALRSLSNSSMESMSQSPSRSSSSIRRLQKTHSGSGSMIDRIHRRVSIASPMSASAPEFPSVTPEVPYTSMELIQFGPLKTDVSLLKARAEYLVLTDTCLIKFGSVEGARAAFPQIKAGNGTLKPHSAHHNAHKSSSDVRMQVPLRSIVGVFNEEGSSPRFGVEIWWFSQWPKLAYSRAHLFFMLPKDRDDWLASIQQACRMSHRRAPSPSLIPGNLKARINHIVETTEPGSNTNASKILTFPVVKRTIGAPQKTNSADDSQHFVDGSSFYIVIGPAMLYFLEVLKADYSTPPGDLRVKVQSYGTVSLIRFRASVASHEQRFVMSFRLPLGRENRLELASVHYRHVIEAMTKVDRELKPMWPQHLQKAIFDIKGLPPPLQLTSGNDLGGLERSLHAYCAAFKVQVPRWTIEWNTPSQPAFRLLPPGAQPYSTLQLLALFRALRYNSYFKELSFRNIDLSGIAGKKDYSHFGDTIAYTSLNGVKISEEHYDILMQSSVLSQEMHALAFSSESIRSMDLKNILGPRSTIGRAKDPEGARRVSSEVLRPILLLLKRQACLCHSITMSGNLIAPGDVEELANLLVLDEVYMRKLDLSNCGLGDEGLTTLWTGIPGQGTNLQHIDTSENQGTVKFETMRDSLSQLRAIRKLNIAGNTRIPFDVPLFEDNVLSSWSLEELDLSGIVLNNPTVDILTAYLASQNSENLRVLRLSKCGLTGAQIAQMFYAMGQARPITLYINGNRLDEGIDDLCAVISECFGPWGLFVQMVEFALETNYIKLLKSLTVNQTIECLSLAGTATPDSASETACRALSDLFSQNHTIRFLDLSGFDAKLDEGRLGREFSKALGGLRFNTRLEHLRVRSQMLNVNIGDLAEAISANKTLHSLDCEGNDFNLSNFRHLVRHLSDSTTIRYFSAFSDRDLAQTIQKSVDSAVATATSARRQSMISKLRHEKVPQSVSQPLAQQLRDGWEDAVRTQQEVLERNQLLFEEGEDGRYDSGQYGYLLCDGEEDFCKAFGGLALRAFESKRAMNRRASNPYLNNKRASMISLGPARLVSAEPGARVTRSWSRSYSIVSSEGGISAAESPSTGSAVPTPPEPESPVEKEYLVGNQQEGNEETLDYEYSFTDPHDPDFGLELRAHRRFWSDEAGCIEEEEHGVQFDERPSAPSAGASTLQRASLVPSQPPNLASLRPPNRALGLRLANKNQPAMYSNSNTFLGGNSQRPGGQQQYGGGSFGSIGAGQQQQPGQPSPFAPQPTGFGQAPLQQQYTGFPMQGQGLQPQQPLQQQFTGFPGQQQQQQPPQQNFQTGAPTMPSIPPQFQQQFQQQQFQQQQQQQPTSFSSSPQQVSGPSNPPPAPMKPQATGFTEMAASFQTGGTAKPRGRRQEKSQPNKIPNIRLSFITAQDQAKFETLFKSAVGEAGMTMSGEKARDLLMRSRLDGDSLSHIWTLADTTRAGQLYFPEFALAMYLCNLKLTGKQLPANLPENIKNEVSSMVDIISFSVADDSAPAAGSSSTPDIRTNTATPPTIQQPQPQPQASNAQLLQAQMTGFPGQQTGFGQQQGLQNQQTGYPGMQNNPQATGYNGPRPPMPPMPPMPTGFGQSLTPGSVGGMAAPLNAQPTGRPGQWGLVNAPSTGLPNIDALQAQMMPQQGREAGNFTTQGLKGNAVIPWAITKEEKTRYDSLFKAWDGLGKGYIGGDQAIEIFGQSGLEKPDLERVWTLADHGNKGRLDLDEFAVAMHLIYRKLNGYPLPNNLPPELVPPSTRNFSQSIGTLKSMLHDESEFRTKSGAALLPQKTGVSYMKNRSFRGAPAGAVAGRKDATVFKNDDEQFGYRSSARRRVGNNSPRPESPASVASNDDLTLDQLKKKIKEKEVLLDAMDFTDEKNHEEDDILDRRDRREAEELYRRIRRIQEDIDSHPDAALASGDSEAERRALKRQLQNLTDKVPELASQVRRTEKVIMEARLELFRIKDAKAHPGSGAPIVGTGPGGTVTESDRLKARAKAMMQQRTAALTGKKVDIGTEDLDAPKRLEEESIKVKNEKESNERMVRDVEESVRDFAHGIEDSLKDGGRDNTSEHEKRRWEDALGVEDEVRDFIFDLQRESRSARLRAQDRRPARVSARSEETLPERVASPRVESSAPASRTATPPAGGSYSSYKTPEERAAFIKQQAEQRMAERLAALGIKAPTKSGETAAQRMERERAERAAKLRQAEEEDARREADRQARLAEEQGIPPPAPEQPKAEAKRPPPPPTRHRGKPEADQEVAKKAEEDAATKQAEEGRLAREHEQQQRETQQMEADAKEQEDDLAKEREASEARLKALEEQVRQGKIRKEEEKKRKKAAMAEAKEKEAKLAARRAEIEAARQRELELQRQLEAMEEDDSSSSDEDEGPQQITPQASTPTRSDSQVASQELDKTSPPLALGAVSSPPPPPAVITSPPSETESKNPFFRMMSQSTEGTSATAAAAPPPPAPPAPAAPAPSATNPFHRMTQTQEAKAPSAPVSRRRADTDDWGSDNDDKDDDSDDERPGGGSAAQLASMLFGTMAPPRPLSAAGRESATGSPVAASATSPAAPPPPPPMPNTDSPAPMTFPPPPPPLPGSDAPVVPPPPP
ncbi:NLRC3, partial [Fusarium beomiforme]